MRTATRMKNLGLLLLASLSLALARPVAAAEAFDCMIEARQSLEIRSSVEAVIESVRVQRGDFVSKGQVLVKYRLPCLFDDRQGLQFFGHGSQLYILAGMKFPFVSGSATRHFVDPRQAAGYERLLEEYRRRTLAACPDHTEYVRSLHAEAGRVPS